MRLMKRFAIVVIFILMGTSVFPALVATLPEIMKPISISVHGDEMFIMEGAVIHVYSLKSKKMLRKFGKKGEGPGELMDTPFFLNKINFHNNSIVVETVLKLVYFDKTGKLQKEFKKKNVGAYLTTPFGNNFVVTKVAPGADNKTIYNAVCILDSEMNEVKELFRQEHTQQGTPPNLKINLLMEFPVFRIAGDKVFIEEGVNGFIIQVYDGKGNKLNRIERKDLKKVSIPQSYKDKLIEKFKVDPIIKSQGGFEAIKNIVKFVFPETFPLIQNIEVSNDKLYVQTYNVKDGKNEYLIMDHNGKNMKRVWLPYFDNVSIMGKVLGAKLNTIYEDKLYYLMENEDDEEWELYVEAIDVK
jgi:hypothetical protein